MVDTFMGCEQTKSMLYRGLCESKSVAEGETDAVALAKTVHALKATVARYGKIIGEEAIQLHGGIAYTMEHPAHLYWRRAQTGQWLYASSDKFRDLYLIEMEAKL